MSDAAKQRVSICDEVTPGTTPATPAWYAVNYSRHTLQPQLQTVESALVRSTRDVADAIRVGHSAGGTIESELQYDVTGSLWKLIKAALQTDAETAATTEVTSVTSVDPLDDEISGTGLATGIEVGDIIRIRDGSNALVGYRKVTSVTAGTPDILGIGEGIAAGSSYKVLRGIRLKNGSTAYPKSIELADDTNGDGTKDVFEYLTYCMVDGLTVRIQQGRPTTISFNIVSAASGGLTGTRITGSTDNAAPTSEVMNPVGHVAAIRVAATDYTVTELSMTLANGSQPRLVAGRDGAESIRSGTLRVIGSTNAYFSSMTEYNKAFSDTATDLFFVLRNSSGQAYAITIPRVKYTAVSRPNQGQDTDIFVRLDFSGVRDSTSSASIRWLAFAN